MQPTRYALLTFALVLAGTTLWDAVARGDIPAHRGPTLQIVTTTSAGRPNGDTHREVNRRHKALLRCWATPAADGGGKLTAEILFRPDGATKSVKTIKAVPDDKDLRKCTETVLARVFLPPAEVESTVRVVIRMTP